jgi:DNA repair protein RadD
VQLRDYQTAATDAVFDWFSNRSDPTLVVLPTGSGKSLCIAALIRDVLIDEPGEHVLVLSHRREILQQDAAQLQKLIPHVSIGVFSAGLGRKQLRQVTVAGIQSVVRAKYLPPFRLIIIDEAHLLPPSGDGIYRRVISRLLEAQPDARIVGYSATPFRQSGYLHEGDNALFAGICFEMPIGKLVDEGYLVPLVTKQTKTQADLTGVHMRGGEFVANEAEAAMDKEELTRAAVEEICRYGTDRKSWLVFAAGVAHAEHVREELQRRGIDARSLFGHTDMGTRDRLLRDFKAQRLRCLVSVSTLTTGFDAPCTDLVAILRPIGSASLWVQCLGRGTRTSPETGKRDCLVLDFAGCVTRCGLIDDPLVRGRSKKSGEQKAPVKICPSCLTAVATAVRNCPECDYEWEFKETKHAATASATRVMKSAEPAPQTTLPVLSVMRNTQTTKG